MGVRGELPDTGPGAPGPGPLTAPPHECAGSVEFDGDDNLVIGSCPVCVAAAMSASLVARAARDQLRKEGGR